MNVIIEQKYKECEGLRDELQKEKTSNGVLEAQVAKMPLVSAVSIDYFVVMCMDLQVIQNAAKGARSALQRQLDDEIQANQRLQQQVQSLEFLLQSNGMV